MHLFSKGGSHHVLLKHRTLKVHTNVGCVKLSSLLIKIVSLKSGGIPPPHEIKTLRTKCYAFTEQKIFFIDVF